MYLHNSSVILVQYIWITFSQITLQKPDFGTVSQAFGMNCNLLVFKGMLKSSLVTLRLLETCRIKNNVSTDFVCVNRMRKCKASCYVCVTAVDKWRGASRKSPYFCSVTCLKLRNHLRLKYQWHDVLLMKTWETS